MPYFRGCCVACVCELPVNSCVPKLIRREYIDIPVFCVSRGFLEIPRARRQRSEDGIMPQCYVMLIYLRGAVTQWMRHWPTEPGIAGSSPGVVILAAPLETDVNRVN